jgi:acyl-CoA thioesterase I
LLQISLIVSPLVAFNCIAAQTILVFGDSLSAAYGIEQKQGWVTLLQQKLQQSNYTHRVINASISGETTAGGLARIDQTLKQHQPNIVILELGANDGLRGLPIKEMHQNLEKMLARIQKTTPKIVLVGMKIPPNYGVKYTQSFAQTYTALAKQHRVIFVPFLLEGVAGNRALNQADGVHPIAKAQTTLLNNIWPHLAPILK